MPERLRFFLNRLRERLWVKPLMVCLLSIGLAFVAESVDRFAPALAFLPEISRESIQKLLEIMSSSMLVIAVLSVGSMLSAYRAASASATPRSFPLEISDDVSQNALSTFIGAFIFSLVALVALMNGYYGKAGLLTIFVFIVLVFSLVILQFLKWVDQIARLGRMETTISKLEAVAKDGLCRQWTNPHQGANPATGSEIGTPVYAACVGYVQLVNLRKLQSFAEHCELEIEVNALPGCFVTTDKVLAYVRSAEEEQDLSTVEQAFLIGEGRTFDEDPRFAVVALSEIASRALSPGINDPGTAMAIIGSLVRLFSLRAQLDKSSETEIKYSRVYMPAILLNDLFDDAFNALARDGAGTIEVMMRLQKALCALAAIDDPIMQNVAKTHAELAYQYAVQALPLEAERQRLRQLCCFEFKDEFAP